MDHTIQEQTSCFTRLIEAQIRSQTAVTTQLELQAAAFKAVHTRFAGLIEDEARGGQVPQMVRKILSKGPQEEAEFEAAMQAAISEIDPMESPKFGAPVKRRAPEAAASPRVL